MRLFFALFLGLLPTLANAITVDDFTTPQSVALTTDAQRNASSIVPSHTFFGGYRQVDVQRDSSAPGVTLTVGGGTLAFSLNDSAQGSAVVTWRLDPTRANASQGVDITQDGSTKFRLGVRSFDYAFRKPIVIKLTVFDARDGSFQTGSSSQLELATEVVPGSSSATVLEFPLSSFVPMASGATPASFAHVGAISLTVVSGAIASDLRLSSLTTDGLCTIVPDLTGRVIDECGVCGGDDSSCKDCKGVPNGRAALDRCNVCEGDGLSCISCIEKDQSALLAALDGGAKKQEKIIKDLLQEFTRSPKRATYTTYVNDVKVRVHALQIRNWVISWTLPRLSRVCSAGGEFCAKSSTVGLLNEYRQHAEEILKIHNDVAARVVKLRKTQTRQVRNLVRQGRDQYATNIALTTSVPVAQYSCS